MDDSKTASAKRPGDKGTPGVIPVEASADTSTNGDPEVYADVNGEGSGTIPSGSTVDLYGIFIPEEEVKRLSNDVKAKVKKEPNVPVGDHPEHPGNPQKGRSHKKKLGLRKRGEHGVLIVFAVGEAEDGSSVPCTPKLYWV